MNVPTYTEILEGFSEIVRLSLRYCSGLRKFVIYTPFTLPKADPASSSNNSQVYANGFDILRWLPQQCEVILVGNTSPDIDAVVSKHRILAKSQDKVRQIRLSFILICVSYERASTYVSRCLPFSWRMHGDS